MSMNDKKTPRSISEYIEVLKDAKTIPLGFCNDYGYSTLEEAVRYAESGKCQLLLLLVSIIGISTTSAFPTIINSKLNEIQCEIELNYENRKALNNVVFLGLIMGGITSSLLADTLSRKWILIVNLVLNAIGCGAMTFVIFPNSFLYLRALISFTSSSITAIIVTHLSEFQLRYYRGSVIVCLQFGWLLGVLAIPFLTDLWRNQIALIMIPSLLSAFLFLFFPDSPGFLFSRGRSKEALLALQFIFSVNTGKTKKEYPIHRLKDNKNPFNLRRHSVIKHYVPPALEPKFICIPIIMLSQFIFMFSYCTVTFWFPIMSQRLPGIFPLINDTQIPQDCVVGFIVIPKRKERGKILKFTHVYPNITELQRTETITQLCDMTTTDPKFFKINIMTTVITCMPIMIFTVLKIDAIGRKFFIMLAHFLAACLAFLSFFMHQNGKGLLYACVFDSVTIIAVSVVQCLAVELFPTRIRVFGVSIVLAAGSVGLSYAANGGMLVYDMTCIVLLSMCGIFLEISGIMIMILPDTAGINLR